MIFGNFKNVELIKKSFELDPVLLIPVLSDPKQHWCINRLSFLYAYNLNTHQELLIGINHNDLDKFEASFLKDLFKGNVFVYKKKYVSAFLTGSNIFDVEMLHWYLTNSKVNTISTPSIKRYWVDFKQFSNINDFIPIMLYLEYCRELRDLYLYKIDSFEITEPFLQYQRILDNFAKIEKSGIYTV